MSIWGKILGGAAGFAVGGPLGALLGATLGHAVDSYRGNTTTSAATEATQQIAFTIAVIVLGAKMAKADGKVTRDEVDAFKRVFKIPAHEMKNVGRLFDQARRDSLGFEPYARQVARLLHDKPELLEELLDGLFHIAQADGIVPESELNYLRQIASIFGFDEASFNRIRAANIGPDKSDPYHILGVKADIDDAGLKAAYRKLVREHHPDRLIAQGMPQEFVDMANEKLAHINEAYRRLAIQRGIR